MACRITDGSKSAMSGWPIKPPAIWTLAYALAGFAALGSASGATTKVFILAGQSNMAGFGLVSDPDVQKPNYPNIRIYRALDNAPSVSAFPSLVPGNSGFPAGYPMDDADFPNGSFPATFGPELGIAKVLTAKYPADKLAFIKVAYGGTNLTQEWVGNTAPKYVYSWFQQRVTEAMTALGSATGGDYQICGIIWMQGESDGADAALSAKGLYESSLKTLVNTLFRGWLTTTRHYNVKTVNGVIPFALGQIKLGSYWKYATAINQEMFRAQSSIPGVRCTDGSTRAATYPVAAPLRPDLYPFNPAHYTAKGQMDVGVSLGNAIAEALDGKTGGCRSDFSPSDNLSQVMD
jgi:hypothetical protein